MIYQIEGIANKIEWDGVNPPKALRQDGKGYLKIYLHPQRPGRPCYSLRDENHVPVRVSVGKLILMLRTGISYEVCRMSRVSVDSSGKLRDYTRRSRAYSLFENIEECEETVRIIRALADGDCSPFYSRMQRDRYYVRNLLYRNWNVPYMMTDRLYDEALEITERKLRELRFREICRIHVYVCRTIFKLYKSSCIRFNDDSLKHVKNP